MNEHRWTASLRIECDAQCEERVRELIPLRPTSLQVCPRRPDHIRWELEFHSPPHEGFTHLIHHIHTSLEPYMEGLSQAREIGDAYLWVGVFYHTVTVSYCLTPEALKELSLLHIPVYISSYPCTRDDD